MTNIRNLREKHERPLISTKYFLTDAELQLWDRYLEDSFLKIHLYTNLALNKDSNKDMSADEIENTLDIIGKNLDDINIKIDNLKQIAQDRYFKELETNRDRIITDAKELLSNIDNERLIESLYGRTIIYAYKIGDIIEQGIEGLVCFELFRRLIEQHNACDKYNYNDIFDLLCELERETAVNIVSTFTDEQKEQVLKIIDNYKDTVEEPIKEIVEEPTSTLDKLLPIIKSNKFYMNNTMISNNMTTIFDTLVRETPNGQLSLLPIKVQLDISGDAKKKEVFNKISFTYGGELSFNKARIKEYDRLILDAVCTILYAGNGVMSDADIFRTLKGYKGTKTKPSQKQLERIREGMLKMSGTRMYADITEELNRGYLKTENEELKKGVWDKAIVEYDGLELIAPNGSIQKVYSFKDNRGNIRYPMIMQYCQAKGQIVSYPIELLDTPEHYTEAYTLIKSYLLKEITNYIKGHRNNNNVIAYSSMYKKCGLEEPTDKTLRKRDRDAIKNMLDYWKEKNYIKGYKDHKQGRAITGIEFIAEVKK